MDTDELKALIDLMNSNDLLELEVVEEGKKIRLKKMYEGNPKIVSMPVAPPSIPSSAPASTAQETSDQTNAQTLSGHVIKSPMVGTFYRSPNPESSPYVDVGSEVTEETVVCILEAMKVFNEIKAEVKGKIKEILVEDGESVEYGQPLFSVDPA